MTPELRTGPPWIMQEMIEAQTGLIGAAMPGADAIAEAVSLAAHDGTPIVVTGCGTSEHGAMAIAEQLADALRAAGAAVRVEARQALDAAIDPRAGGICIAVSHEGTTRATVLALEAARAAGAATASVGAQPESPLALLADHKLTTPLLDGSWCHTVAYASSILAGAAIGRAITRSETDAGPAIQETLAVREQIDALAERIHGTARILTVGLGADLVTARELALKIEEGARIPSTALHLESLLHGHLAGCDADRTSLVLFAADARGGARRDWRLKCAAGAAGAIGIATIAIGEATAVSGLPGAVDTLVVPPAPQGAEVAHALLTGALSLQLLTLSLAHLVGVNPDLIRREQAPYREAAALAENRTDW